MEKLTRMEELEKEAAVMERKELYDQRRSRRSKVARLTQHMATVEMVGLLPTSLVPKLPLFAVESLGTRLASYHIRTGFCKRLFFAIFANEPRSAKFSTRKSLNVH